MLLVRITVEVTRDWDEMYKSISDYVYFLSPEFRKSLELNSAFQIKKKQRRGNNKLCTLLGSECTGGKDEVYTQNWVNSSYLNSFIRNLCTPLGSTCCCLQKLRDFFPQI